MQTNKNPSYLVTRLNKYLAYSVNVCDRLPIYLYTFLSLSKYRDVTLPLTYSLNTRLILDMLLCIIV